MSSSTAQENKAPASAAPSLDFHTDLPVGEILRRTRIHYGQSLDDVSNFLRIRISQIDALEKGDIDKLPGRVYAIGYVRTYSEYLGLDGEKMIQLFKAQMIGKPAKPELYFPVAASESKAPSLYIVFGSLATLVLMVGVWVVLNMRGEGADSIISTVPNVPADIRAIESPPPQPAPIMTEQTPTADPSAMGLPSGETPPAADAAVAGPPLPVPEAEAGIDPAAAPDQAQTQTQTQTQTPADPAAVPPPAPVQKREITINVKEKSWVEVRDRQGKPILSRILTPGEVFIVPEQNYGLRLDTGNAGGLEILVNGQPLPPLGHTGDILRGLVLDGDRLVQKLNNPRPATDPTQ